MGSSYALSILAVPFEERSDPGYGSGAKFPQIVFYS